MGEPIEHEHTKDHDLARDIALQHLDEIPDYYTRLKKMESDAKKTVKEQKNGRCPAGQYYCYTNKECKPIPAGFMVDPAGMLRKENGASIGPSGRKFKGGKSESDKRHYLKNREKRIEEMNAFELHERIQMKRQTGQDSTDDAVKFHMKFAVPFASLIFSILGACIGVRPHRSSSAIGLGISLIIILLYYVLIGFGIGGAHFLTPILAAWLPNILVGAAGFYLLQKMVNR